VNTSLQRAEYPRQSSGAAGDICYIDLGKIRARIWVLEWSDGAERFFISGDFDLICDLAEALRTMIGGEVETVWMAPFPKQTAEEERKRVKAGLWRTRARMRAPHFSGETVNRYWRMLVMQTGQGVEFPYV
jgi:hypothetical protein